jgi:hypothetical protein
MIVRTEKVGASPPVAAGGSPAPRAGLSLLEVLAALTIFLFSLIALGRLIDVGGERARDVQYLSRASMIAQTKMSEVMAGVLPLTGSPESPAEDDPNWTWSVEATADGTPNLYHVTVTVSRALPDGSRFEVKLNQFVLDPAARGNTDGSATTADDTGTTGTGTTSTGGM